MFRVPITDSARERKRRRALLSAREGQETNGVVPSLNLGGVKADAKCDPEEEIERGVLPAVRKIQPAVGALFSLIAVKLFGLCILIRFGEPGGDSERSENA